MPFRTADHSTSLVFAEGSSWVSRIPCVIDAFQPENNSPLSQPEIQSQPELQSQTAPKQSPFLQPQPSSMRASDSDRQLVIDVLNVAFTEGRLDPVEHQERLEVALAARTFGELESLTSDLVLAPQNTGEPVYRPQPARETQPAVSMSNFVVSIFAGVERKGRWTVKESLNCLVTFGGADIDMREAVFEEKRCVVNVLCMFGGLNILVPEGVGVEFQVVPIFGGAGTKTLAPAQPGYPTVVVRGLVTFGGVSVGHTTDAEDKEK